MTRTHCACGAKLPPYSGRGRRPSKCDECKHKRRQRERLRYEQWRYANDPGFRAMKQDGNRRSRARRRD